MSEPFIAEIIMFGGNFAPRNWAFCDGQLLSISSNQALFALVGTTYGGDGRVTFGLPEMRGRAPVHEGSGSGLNPVTLGQRSGANNHTLATSQLPAHNHSLQANTSGASTEDPSGGTLGEAGANIYNETAADVPMSPTSIGNTGGGQQFSIMQPFLGINFIIALFGTFPSRN